MSKPQCVVLWVRDGEKPGSMVLVPVTCREIIAAYAGVIGKLSRGEKLDFDEEEIVSFIAAQREGRDEKAREMLSVHPD